MNGLDVRDLNFWIHEAERKLIEDRLSAMFVSRMANVRDQDFQREVMRLQYSLKLYDLEEKSK